MEVEMTIRGLMLDPTSNMPIVILKDVGGETVLPIWVGVYEANAIALEMEKVSTPRPMTHDLIKNVLMGLETKVHKVVVTELREDTFYAVIWLDHGGEVISIDSRPSDALALALRVDCPIYVDELVFKASKLAASASDRLTSEDLRKYLEGLDGVTAVHDLHIWPLSTTRTALTVHLEMPDAVGGDVFLQQICERLRAEFQIEHSTIQIEQNAEVCALAPDPSSLPR